jgi:hypothetical protein
MIDWHRSHAFTQSTKMLSIINEADQMLLIAYGWCAHSL